MHGRGTTAGHWQQVGYVCQSVGQHAEGSSFITRVAGAGNCRQLTSADRRTVRTDGTAGRLQSPVPRVGATRHHCHSRISVASGRIHCPRRGVQFTMRAGFTVARRRGLKPAWWRSRRRFITPRATLHNLGSLIFQCRPRHQSILYTNSELRHFLIGSFFHLCTFRHTDTHTHTDGRHWKQ